MVAGVFADYQRTHAAPHLVAALTRVGVIADKKTTTTDTGGCNYEDHCRRQWDQGAIDLVWITDFT